MLPMGLPASSGRQHSRPMGRPAASFAMDRLFPGKSSARKVGSGFWTSRCAQESSTLAPVAPELGPVIQPLADLAFETSFRRIVIAFALHRLGKIILAGKRVRFVMIVLVAGAIFLLFHQPRRCIEDDLGRRQGAGLLG